jgi:hypothetical protein
LFHFHIHLEEVVKPILNEISDFNWFLSALEYIADTTDLPINLDKEYFVLDKHAFEKVLSYDIQFIWRAILGFPPGIKMKLDQSRFLFVEGNELIWKPANIQIPGAAI